MTTQAQISRRTRDLCQDCWQDAHPTEYAPVATRYGPCAECGAEALIVRSIIAQERGDEIAREARAMAQGGLI